MNPTCTDCGSAYSDANARESGEYSASGSELSQSIEGWRSYWKGIG